MKYRFSPFLEYERVMRKKIHDSLEGGIIDQIIKATGAMEQQDDSTFRASLAVSKLKVEPEVMPRLYQLFQETINRLGFDRQVEFYITNSKDINACTYFGTTPNRPLIIDINSALIEMMNEDELRFVVGHELGHQINKDGELNRLISFVFPDLESMSPLLLQLKVCAWKQLCELVADRFGFLATGNRDACISAFFKLHSGLNLKGMNIDIDAFVRHNHKLMDHFCDGEFLSLSNFDHPVDVIRVDALNAFATARTKEELEQTMMKVVVMINRISTSETDDHIAYFMAAAGLLIANADGEVTKEEQEAILQKISQFDLFPMSILEDVAEGDVMAIFNEHLSAILEKSPERGPELFQFVMDQVMSDNKLNAEEVNLMFTIGVKSFGYSKEDVMNAFAVRLREVFRPSFSSIC